MPAIELTLTSVVGPPGTNSAGSSSEARSAIDLATRAANVVVTACASAPSLLK